MLNKLKVSFLLLPLVLSACASVPNGPSTMALPGTNKNFDQFRADDASCQQFAQSQIGGTTANQAANSSFATSAVLGTAIGAAIGALAGHGHGVGVGAAAGLAMGSVIGASESNLTSGEAQRRYDNAYTQCMYASGHRVAVSGSFETQQRASNIAPPSQRYYAPPPPPPPGYAYPVPPDAPR
jgi:hypothetical protein